MEAKQHASELTNKSCKKTKKETKNAQKQVTMKM